MKKKSLNAKKIKRSNAIIRFLTDVISQRFIHHLTDLWGRGSIYDFTST